MNNTAQKPWSATGADDPGDECADSGISTADTAHPPGGVVERPRSQELDASPSAAMMRNGPALSPRWALVPLVLALGWCGYAAVRPEPARNAWIATGLVATGLAALVLACASQRRDVAMLAGVVRSGRSAPSGGLPSARVTGDLQPLSRELFSHLDRLSDALTQKHDRGVELGYRLAETEHRHTRRLIENLTDGLVVIDPFDRILQCNPAALAMLGMGSADVTRRLLGEFVKDESLLSALRQAHHAPLNSRRSVEHVIGERTLLVTLTAMATAGDAADRRRGSDRAAEGQAAQQSRVVVLMLRDITREKEANKVTSQFVSHVAHEMRTPLSSLKAYVEMLTDGEAQDERTRREYYNIIQAETDRMARLIDEILSISRIESGLVKVSREPVSLAVLVREVVDIMRPQADRKNITLRDELAPVMHQVSADRDMIHQAILNLCSNAVKYTPEGGRVFVRMKVDEQAQTITTEVADTGVGIPQEDLPKMFQKFFRVKANNKMAKGTGLGLNLVRNIVETVHGGKVGLTSVVNQGSTFSMTLPLIGGEK